MGAIEQVMRQPDVVAIVKRDIAAVSVIEASVARTVRPLVSLIDISHRLLPSLRQMGDEFASVVRTAVIDDDELPIGKLLTADGREDLRQELRTIIRRQDNADGNGTC